MATVGQLVVCSKVPTTATYPIVYLTKNNKSLTKCLGTAFTNDVELCEIAAPLSCPALSSTQKAAYDACDKDCLDNGGGDSCGGCPYYCFPSAEVGDCTCQDCKGLLAKDQKECYTAYATVCFVGTVKQCQKKPPPGYTEADCFNPSS
jgi:hypothetical protein